MFGFCLCVTVLVSACSVVQSVVIPDGALRMECHERYFMIAVNLSITGEQLRFEAVDDNDVYPITERYGAQHGYTVQVFPLQGLVELRASYFSLHTDNKDDKVFGFRFNLIVVSNDVELTYPLSESCSSSLPWSPREVTCEANYMEVHVRSEVTCSSGISKDDWNSLKAAHSSTTSDWQVMFQQGEEKHSSMTLSEASKQGYLFYLTDGRLVFRTPYSQPHSLNTEVNGVPVEVVHVTIYSRQSWVVLMVDLVAACSMDVGSPVGAHMVWETPDMLYPSFSITQVSVGLNGKLLNQQSAEDEGYAVQKRNSKFQISVPFDADGTYRKSIVNGSLFHFYIFRLYFEQILLDEDQVETRLRLHRTLATVVPSPLFVENRTVLEEMMFTVYLGDVPEDVVLTAICFNGEECVLPYANLSSLTFPTVTYGNGTKGFALRVPFDHPVVERKFIKEEGVVQHVLRVKYTLTILPENATYHHPAVVVALLPHISPPDVNASCLDSGIVFTLEHQPLDHLWQITVGSDPLTPELAAGRGYVMSNDSGRLRLDVPLFTTGYKYTNLTLKGFSATFEVLVRGPESWEVHSNVTKTCSFSLSEYIICSNNGGVTVAVDLGVVGPARTHLLDKTCRPGEAEGTRAWFSFSVNSCGSTVEVHGNTVTYHNEVFFPDHVGTSGRQRLLMRCSYEVGHLHQLFSSLRFQSDTAGLGAIVRAGRKDLTTVLSPARTTQPTHVGTVKPVQPTHVGTVKPVQPTHVGTVKPVQPTHVGTVKPVQQSVFRVDIPHVQGYLDHIRGEFDKLYSNIKRWISENYLYFKT